MNIIGQRSGLGLGLWLGFRVAGVSYASLSPSYLPALERAKLYCFPMNASPTLYRCKYSKHNELISHKERLV